MIESSDRRCGYPVDLPGMALTRDRAPEPLRQWPSEVAPQSPQRATLMGTSWTGNLLRVLEEGPGDGGLILPPPAFGLRFNALDAGLEMELSDELPDAA